MRRHVMVQGGFWANDGRWYPRMLSDYGAELGVSKGYTRKWSARLAQRLLKRILNALEI